MFGRATIRLGIGPHSSSCMVMGICDISLQDMSLTHKVLNDNLSQRCGLYSATVR